MLHNAASGSTKGSVAAQRHSSMSPPAKLHRLQSRRSPRRGGSVAAQHGPPAGSNDSQGDLNLSPQEALLAALREAGTPLEQIQLGRAEGDDETWLDILDAEQDEWMRSPPPMPEFVEELLGSSAEQGRMQQQQQLPPQLERKQPDRPPQGGA